MITSILKVKTGQELTAHEVLAKAGFDVYTPFFERSQQEKVSQKQRALMRRNRQRLKNVHHAEPYLSGWLFVRFEQTSHNIYKLFTYLEQKRYLYGVLTLGGELYPFSDERMSRFKQLLSEMEKVDPCVKARGYDPKRDSRKNKQRKYADNTPIIFNEGEGAEFMDGAFAGLMFEVVGMQNDLVSLEIELFGRQTLVEAYPEDLRKIVKAA